MNTVRYRRSWEALLTLQVPVDGRRKNNFYTAEDIHGFIAIGRTSIEAEENLLAARLQDELKE